MTTGLMTSRAESPSRESCKPRERCTIDIEAPNRARPGAGRRSSGITFRAYPARRGFADISAPGAGRWRGADCPRRSRRR